MKVKRFANLHFFISLFIILISGFLVYGDQDGDSYDWPLDCNDANASIYPGAAEICNGFDDDCDGSLDEGCSTDCGNPDIEGGSKRVTADASTSEVASISWAGTNCGIAWHDNRDANQYEIYFALADGNGNKIGSDKRITSAASSQKEPSLVWTGTEFGLAFDDYRNSNYEIYFARLDSSGNKISAETRITQNSYASRYPTLAWNGSEYGAVWQDNRDGNYEIYFSKINADGTKNGSDIRISSATGNSYYPVLIWDGDGYGAAWQDERDGNREIYFSQLDVNGSEVISDLRLTGNTAISEYPDICWTGSEYGIVWDDTRDGNAEIYFARISGSGVKVGDDTRITINDQSSVFVTIAWTGSEYGVVWQDSRDGNTEIYFGRVSSTGGRIGGDLRVTRDSGNSYLPDIVRTGSDFGTAWHDDRDSNREIYFQKIGCDCVDADSDLYTSCNDCNDSDSSINPGAVDICNSVDDDCDGTVDGDTDKDGYLPCEGDCDNGDPAVHPGDTEICNDVDDNCDDQIDYVPDNDADGYLYCSGDRNDSDPDIHPGATEVCNGADDDCDGSVDEGCQTTCANKERMGGDERTTEDYYASREPSLALSSEGYAICWQDDRDSNGTAEIYYALYDFDGKKITPDVRITASLGNSINSSAVWSGKEFGMAWQDNRDTNDEIYFARFDKNGNKLGSDMRVTRDPSSSQNPSLVWNGNGYSLAWNDGRDKNDEIYFVRLDKEGNKIGADMRITKNTTASIDPSLVWDLDGYGVAWKDWSGSFNPVYFARLDIDGSKIGSDIKVNDINSNSDTPFLVWASDRYGIAWKDNRNAGKWQIYFAQFDSAGAKIGSDSRITDNLDLSNAGEPSLGWSGGEYGASWTDQRDGNSEIYFARIDTSGTPVESNFKFTNNPANSSASSLVWDGSQFVLAWEDDRDTNYEIYFGRLGCNCTDVDGDSYTSCNDCNDGNPNVHPGATETCNAIDDDCDGTIDEGFDADSDGWTTCGGDCNDNDGSVFQIPSEVSNLRVKYKVNSEISWTSQSLTAGAGTVYDIINGSITSLRTNKDFRDAVCFEDGSDIPTNSYIDSQANPAAGDGYYYLVRAHNTCGTGTYGNSSLTPDPRDNLDTSSPCL